MFRMMLYVYMYKIFLYMYMFIVIKVMHIMHIPPVNQHDKLLPLDLGQTDSLEKGGALVAATALVDAVNDGCGGMLAQPASKLRYLAQLQERVQLQSFLGISPFYFHFVCLFSRSGEKQLINVSLTKTTSNLENIYSYIKCSNSKLTN